MSSPSLLDSQSCQTLADWLCYIEQSHPIHKIELGLDRIRDVASKADLQILPGKKILIAGTNGKGTTARCLEAMLLAQGKTVAVYSSPHLIKFNERLRLNGQDVADENWLDAFSFVEKLRGETPLTYFEFTTLVSFYLIKQHQVDYSLIEVGLGGRLDATNIIEPDVSIITTIDLDHQDWLGNDKETIGREKAGVFRSSGIAVIADLEPPQSVLDVASKLKCKTLILKCDFHYQEQADTWSWQGQTAQLAQLPFCGVPVQNIASSLAVLEQLNSLPSAIIIQHVLTHLTLAGRMQWLSQSPAIMVDVAHNPQSARYLASQLQQLKPKYKRIRALVGMLKDKDINQTLLPLTSLFEQWHLVSLYGARGASASQLADELIPFQVSTVLHEDVTAAYQHIKSTMQSDELLVVFGSFVTVSAVLLSHQEA